MDGRVYEISIEGEIERRPVSFEELQITGTTLTIGSAEKNDLAGVAAAADEVWHHGLIRSCSTGFNGGC